QIPRRAVGRRPEVEPRLALQDRLAAQPPQPLAHLVAARPAQEGARIERPGVDPPAPRRHRPDVADEEVVEPGAHPAQGGLEAAGRAARSAADDVEGAVRENADDLRRARADAEVAVVSTVLDAAAHVERLAVGAHRGDALVHRPAPRAAIEDLGPAIRGLPLA